MVLGQVGSGARWASRGIWAAHGREREPGRVAHGVSGAGRGLGWREERRKKMTGPAGEKGLERVGPKRGEGGSGPGC